MKSPSRTRSIAARFSWMSAIVSGIALLLAYVSFFTYNLVASRQAAVDSLAVEAQIIGTNSIAAIVFNDHGLAQTNLSALSNSGDVVSATIYTQSGELFASYSASGNQTMPPPPMPDGAQLIRWTSGVDVLVGSRIVNQGKPIGIVYLQAHLNSLRQQATHYAAIAAAILLLCLGVALLAGTIFRRMLSEPVVALARTARLVSRYRDYSLRFEPAQDYDELVSLTEAFNEMLSEIHQRDTALEQARDELEQRVEERTAQLRSANRELESFSYSVAHDLRGPLEVICNICYLMQSHQSDASTGSADPMLDRLSASVADMSNLIDDLLNLSRATSMGLHWRQLNLSATAGSILEDLVTSHPDRNVKTFVQQGCYANGDPGLMQIVMQNLLRNAWKFTGHQESARIEFGCTNDSPESIYYVRDNGAGFDPRQANRLFKPFQRLHTDSEFSGTGIGLATVQRIIARHEGRIWAEGEVGKGATFYFTLGSPKP